MRRGIAVLPNVVRAVLAGVGVVAAWASWQLGMGSLAAPGPGLWPFAVAVILTALVALEALRRTPAAEDLAEGEGRILLCSILAFAGFVLILDRVGFVASALLLLVALLHWMGRGWRECAVVALVAVLASWTLFTRLGVPLPPGRLW